MNGAEVQLWKGLHGFPNKLLPGGYVMGHLGERNPAHSLQDQINLVQVDWEGNIVWKFDRYEYIEDPGEEPQWMARQHHDYQREGNPVGYYVPGMDPLVDRGNTLILAHKNLKNPKISDKMLLEVKITLLGSPVYIRASPKMAGAFINQKIFSIPSRAKRDILICHLDSFDFHPLMVTLQSGMVVYPISLNETRKGLKSVSRSK